MWNKQRADLRRQAGVTLMELIVAMVVITVGVAGMSAVYSRVNRASVDPVVHKQMVAIAEGIMEEVLLKPFAVDGAAAATRADYNDVRDFNGYSTTGITDVNGDAIKALAGYSVAVAVTPVTLSGATEALRITVTVTRGSNTFVLTGWRTNFA